MDEHKSDSARDIYSDQEKPRFGKGKQVLGSQVPGPEEKAAQVT